MDTKPYNFRLPIDLMETAKARVGPKGMTALLTALLQAHLSSPDDLVDDVQFRSSVARVAAAELRVAEMAETLVARLAEIDRLETELAQCKSATRLAQQSGAQLSEQVFRKLQAASRSKQHPSGPVLSEVVPPGLTGEVAYCGLRGLDKKGKPT